VNSTQVKRKEEIASSGGPGLSRMPFLLVSYLPLANVENYWRDFREVYPAPRAQPVYRLYLLHLLPGTNFSRLNIYLLIVTCYNLCILNLFLAFPRRKQKRKTNSTYEELKTLSQASREYWLKYFSFKYSSLLKKIFSNVFIN